MYSSSSPPSSSPPASFENILEKLPEFLLLLLPYIDDRTVWNSIASSNKDTYEQSKRLLLPPWPMGYKLCGHPNETCNNKVTHFGGFSKIQSGVFHDPTFSPNGTQIAVIVDDCFQIPSLSSEDVLHFKIAIFDQQRGPLRFCRVFDDYDSSSNNNNIEYSWIAHDIKGDQQERSHVSIIFCENQLITSGNDGFVRIWNYNTVAPSGDFNYVKLEHEWNVNRELHSHSCSNIMIDVSPCGRFAAVLFVTGEECTGHILLKDINNGKTIKSLTLPENELGDQIAFISNIDDDPSIIIRSERFGGKRVHQIAQIWSPYEDDINSLNTILDEPDNTGNGLLFSFLMDYHFGM